jgi:hypothetical protein
MKRVDVRSRWCLRWQRSQSVAKPVDLLDAGLVDQVRRKTATRHAGPTSRDT